MAAGFTASVMTLSLTVVANTEKAGEFVSEFNNSSSDDEELVLWLDVNVEDKIKTKPGSADMTVS